MAFLNWDDPKNKCCRTCKFIIYHGRARQTRSCSASSIMYNTSTRTMVTNCPDWEVTKDNLKPAFKE